MDAITQREALTLATQLVIRLIGTTTHDTVLERLTKSLRYLQATKSCLEGESFYCDDGSIENEISLEELIAPYIKEKFLEKEDDGDL